MVSKQKAICKSRNGKSGEWNEGNAGNRGGNAGNRGGNAVNRIEIEKTK